MKKKKDGRVSLLSLSSSQPTGISGRSRQGRERESGTARHSPRVRARVKEGGRESVPRVCVSLSLCVAIRTFAKAGATEVAKRRGERRRDREREEHHASRHRVARPKRVPLALSPSRCLGCGLLQPPSRGPFPARDPVWLLGSGSENGDGRRFIRHGFCRRVENASCGPTDFLPPSEP